MKTGRITFGPKSDSGDGLKRALDTIRNPAPGVTLVSHGFKDMKADANRRANQYARVFNAACAGEGHDLPLSLCMKLVALFQHALEAGTPPAAVDPQVTDTGKPTTRV
jgi:hypothetical protein